jgi:hypothetical protein
MVSFVHFSFGNWELIGTRVLIHQEEIYFPLLGKALLQKYSHCELANIDLYSVYVISHNSGPDHYGHMDACNPSIQCAQLL